MVAYILNENVLSEEMNALVAGAGNVWEIRLWPAGTSNLPSGISVAILIVRADSSELEEARALAAINAGIRIVCVFIEKVIVLSPLAEKYCSSKVSVAGGGFADALNGNDQIQEDSEGGPAPRNPQRPHNC